MGCIASTSKGNEEDSAVNSQDNQKAKHEGWESISEKKRGCTDCLCLILLLLSWVATTIVGLIALGTITDPRLPKGNPLRLAAPMDYNGRLCGYDAGVLSRPVGYYLLDKTAVCISACPTTSNYTSFVCKEDYQAAADASISLGFFYVMEQRCMYKIASQPIINRCIPNVVASTSKSAALSAAAKHGAAGNMTNAASYSSGGNKDTGWFQLFLTDVWTIKGLIFGFGLGFSVVVAFSYTYFLRLPGLLFFMIWSILLSVLGVLVAGGLLLFFMAQRWSTDGIHSDIATKTAEYTSYGVFVLSGLYLCLLLVLRSRVQLAIGVVKEAAKALASMPLLIAMPIIQVAGIVVFLVPWIIYVFYLASSGEVVQVQGSYTNAAGITQTYTYRQFVYTENTKYAFLYMLFSWFWTSEFIIALGQLTIALAVVSWYFTRPEHKWKIGSWTVLWAMGTAGLYHSGTAAFGSLVIAIIKTIQAILAYLQRQAKKQNNRALQYLLCVVQCCMWCFEKFMKFLNKNAYIQTAIYGYSFCKAARSAFFLLLRNILRVTAVNMVAEFVLLLGKLFVPCLTTIIFYVILAYTPYAGDINDIVSPSVFVFLLAYIVSNMFSEIFAMTIETVLLCYVADEEMFPLEKRFADGGLKSALQRTAQKHAADSKKVSAAPEEKYAVSPEEKQGGFEPNPSNSQPSSKQAIHIHATSHHHHPEGDSLI
jgi:choline transporter-like protein 2/4/5